MKKTVSYNIKKVLAGTMLAALPFAFGGCEKDPVNQDNGNNTQQKHNVELVYGIDPNTQWQNISMDTLYKYNADPTVDSIFMIPENTTQYTTLNSAQINNVLIPRLRERHNVNPNKVFGKGDLKLNNLVVATHPEMVKFFADTLKYNVVYDPYKKTR